MKSLFFVILLLVSTNAFCKKKPKPVEHIGQMTYHAETFHSLLEGRSDLFEDGDYVCLPGDEHHAPTCKTRADWIVTDAFGYVEIKLDDGSTVVVTDNPGPGLEDQKHEPWSHGNDTTTLRSRWEPVKAAPLFQVARDWEPFLADGNVHTFRYGVDTFGNIYRLDELDLIAAREAKKARAVSSPTSEMK